MPHSISPPQGMCVIASGYSIFLSGLTLERLQKDSLWEKTLGQALPKVSDIMHVITPYSSSAIKNFIGHFFSYHSYYLSCYFQISFCSFLKSMLMVIWQVKQIFQNLKLGTVQLITWTHFTIELYPQRYRILNTDYSHIPAAVLISLCPEPVPPLGATGSVSLTTGCEPTWVKKHPPTVWPLRLACNRQMTHAKFCSRMFLAWRSRNYISPLWWQNFWEVNSGPQMAMFLTLWRKCVYNRKRWSQYNKEAERWHRNG